MFAVIDIIIKNDEELLPPPPAPEAAGGRGKKKAAKPPTAAYLRVLSVQCIAVTDRRVARWLEQTQRDNCHRAIRDTIKGFISECVDVVAISTLLNRFKVCVFVALLSLL